MNIAKLRVDLELDEGCKHEIYKDHLGFFTLGIGHLIGANDPEFGKPVGTPVTDERVQEAFERDLDAVRLDCIKLYPDFDALPDDAKLIIANMMFNLGMGRLLKFKKALAALEAKEWVTAGIEMKDSKWFTQVGPRAGRLIERIRTIDS